VTDYGLGDQVLFPSEAGILLFRSETPQSPTQRLFEAFSLRVKRQERESLPAYPHNFNGVMFKHRDTFKIKFCDPKICDKGQGHSRHKNYDTSLLPLLPPPHSATACDPVFLSYSLGTISASQGTFTEPEGSLPCSLESTTGSCPEPDESSPVHTPPPNLFV
jgi:hypothetical protein